MSSPPAPGVSATPPTPAPAASLLWRNPLLVTVLGALVFAAITAWLQADRLARFEPRSFDLGIYAQIAWNAAHGGWDSSVQQAPSLAVHWSPLFVLIGMLSRVCDAALLLVIVQALALGATAPALYVALRARLGERVALGSALAALCYPPLWTIALADFHPIALGVAPSLAVFWAFDRDRPWLGVGLAAALGVLFHEIYPLTGIGVALALLARKPTETQPRPWKVAGVLAGVSFVAFAVINAWLLPSMRGDALQANVFYAHLGDSTFGVALSPLTRPRAFYSTMMRPSVWLMAAGLLFPLVVLPMLRPRWLLPALPAFMVQALSIRETQQDLDFHYHAPLVPWILVAAAFALADGTKRARGLWLLLAVPLLTLPFFGAVESAVTDAFRPVDPRVPAKAALVAQVPEGAHALGSVDVLHALSRRASLLGMPATSRGAKDWSDAPYPAPAPAAWVLCDTDDAPSFWPQLPPNVRPEFQAEIARGAARWRNVVQTPGRGVQGLAESTVLLGPGGPPLIEPATEPRPEGAFPPLGLVTADLLSSDASTRTFRLRITAPAGQPIPPLSLVVRYEGEDARTTSWPALYRVYDFTPWPSEDLWVRVTLIPNGASRAQVSLALADRTFVGQSLVLPLR